jgi:hypothetical protein
MKRIILILSFMPFSSCKNIISEETSVDPIVVCPTIYRPSPLKLKLNLMHSPSPDFELKINDYVTSSTDLCPDGYIGRVCIKSQAIEGSSRTFDMTIPMNIKKIDLIYSESGSEYLRKYELTLIQTSKSTVCFHDYELTVDE